MSLQQIREDSYLLKLEVVRIMFTALPGAAVSGACQAAVAASPVESPSSSLGQQLAIPIPIDIPQIEIFTTPHNALP